MNIDPFPMIAAADEEVRRDGRYHWNNATRPDAGYCVVQRTLTGAVEFEQAGVKSTAGTGQALLFTHHEDSSYGYPPGATIPYRLQFVAFAPKGLQPFFEHLRREFGSVVAMGPEGQAARVLVEILRRNRRDDFRDKAHVAELLFGLLLSIHREQVAAQQTADPIEFGYHLLNDNAGGRLGVKEIARLAGISREYFIREYARRYHLTPGAALRGLRLERARALILATSLSLTDIAATCGFGSPDALRRSFRQHFGRSPLELR